MKKILPYRPKEYLEQGLTQCGAFSVKAILDAYGKDHKEQPRDYQPNVLAKYTGITLGLAVWPKVLKSYGVPAETGNAKNLSDTQRIELLEKSINAGKVPMLHVGNGYSKSGVYRPLIASFVGHWITLWGYDDEKQVFYIYDSYLSQGKHDKTIPIGNTKRTFSEILRDWGKGFPPAWKYNFIKVG